MNFYFKTFLFFAISGRVFKCAIGKWIPVYNTYKFASERRIVTLFVIYLMYFTDIDY